MAPIVESIEIARRPEDVFSYVTDPARLTEWQESAVSVRYEGETPPAVGSRIVVTRRVGPREQQTTNEVTEMESPRAWAVRGVDGPVRGMVKGTVEPLDEGERSRVQVVLKFEGHGIGKLLAPIVRRQVRAEMPRNHQKLKELLESGT